MCDRVTEFRLVSLSQTVGTPVHVVTSSASPKLQRGVNISVRVLKMWTRIWGSHKYVGKDSSLMRLLRRIGWYIVNDVSKDRSAFIFKGKQRVFVDCHPKDGGTTIIRNAGSYWPVNMVLHTKRLKFSWTNVTIDKQLGKVEVRRRRMPFLSFCFAVAQ